MRIETINETVKVRADFAGGEVTPIAFKRKEKIYRVAKVNARWSDRTAGGAVHYFSVDSSGDTYELSFKTRDMVWSLDRVVLDS